MTYMRHGAGFVGETTLGSINDPMAPDFAADLSDGSSSDPRAAYLAWAAAVKLYGGVVTAFPFHTGAGLSSAAPGTYAYDSSGVDDYGYPAARYPVAVIYPAPSYSLNPIFHTQPNGWTADSAYGYFLAPQSVIDYAAGGGDLFAGLIPTTSGMLTSQAVPGESPVVNPTWYDNLLTGVKAAEWIIGAIALLGVLSYLPRRRG
jgi:hypothetical protein